jgi:hypothetical protein
MQAKDPWWARPRLPLLLVFGVAVLVNLPYLGSGFSADDFIFLELLTTEPRPFSWWGGFWHLTDPTPVAKLDYAPFRPLWWQEPGTMGMFWRPLFSLLFTGSVFVFGDNALPLHAVSLVAHGAVCASLVLFVRQWSGRPGLALLAGLLFATCEDHSLGVGWISTMTDMLCVLLVMLALLGHLGWLRTRRPLVLVASLVALAAAFLSKESAATAPVIIVFLTVVAPRGEAEEITWSRAALKARIVAALRDLPSWLPQAAALLVYLGLYMALGFGGMKNLMYLDPIGNPAAYLQNAALHGPVLVLATLSSVSPSFVMFLPSLLPILAVGGIVSLLVWLVLCWPFRRSGLALWALFTYAVALLPQLSTDASERALYFPFVGAAILLALLLARLREAGPRWRRVVAWLVLLGIATPGVIMSAVMPWSYIASFKAIERQVGSALPHIEAEQPNHTLVLNTSGMMLTIYVGGILEHRHEKRLDLQLLSSCNGVVTLERTAAETFVLRTDRPGWLSNAFARLVRKTPSFEVGRRYDRPHFVATVLEVTDDARDVLAVEFRLTGSQDRLLLRWDGRAFVPLDLAGLPLDEPVLLADTSDVMKAMMATE